MKPNTKGKAKRGILAIFLQPWMSTYVDFISQDPKVNDHVKPPLTLGGLELATTK